jgi:hypothetical protein
MKRFTLIEPNTIWGAHIFGEVCSIVCIASHKKQWHIAHAFSGTLIEANEFINSHGLHYKGIHVSLANHQILWLPTPDQVPEMDKEEQLLLPGEFGNHTVWMLARGGIAENELVPLQIASIRSIRASWPVLPSILNDHENEVYLDFDGNKLLLWFIQNGSLAEYVTLAHDEPFINQKLLYLLRWYRSGVHGEPTPDIIYYSALVPEPLVSFLVQNYPTQHLVKSILPEDTMVQNFLDKQNPEMNTPGLNQIGLCGLVAMPVALLETYQSMYYLKSNQAFMHDMILGLGCFAKFLLA